MADLPIYKCVIDDSLETDLQVEFISFVDKPAIEKNFLAFDQAKLKFDIDTEQRIVSGPAMYADMLIYRNDPEGIGEYYTVFDKQTIQSIVQKFFKKSFGKNVNLMHDQVVEGVTVFESFMTNEARGIKPMKGYEDAGEGSWFVSMKVDNDEVWEKVKSGEVRGFSVEGIFKQIPVKTQKLSKEQAIKMMAEIMSRVQE